MTEFQLQPAGPERSVSDSPQQKVPMPNDMVHRNGAPHVPPRARAAPGAQMRQPGLRVEDERSEALSITEVELGLLTPRPLLEPCIHPADGKRRVPAHRKVAGPAVPRAAQPGII